MKKFIIAGFIAILLLAIPKDATAVTYEKIPYGLMRCSAYCPCCDCSEGYNYTTCTGTRAEEGWTIAVDPDVISLGSKVMIDGKIYIAEDCGGLIKGDKIDIFFEDHEDVDEFGVQDCEVYVLRE